MPIAIGWHKVFTHFGAIITGSFSHKSRMISKDALPAPMIMLALSIVVESGFFFKASSINNRDLRWGDKLLSSFMIAPK